MNMPSTQGWSLAGHVFEAQEKREWIDADCRNVQFEQVVSLPSGRVGRPDILLDEEGGWFTIIEIKASNWDAMARHRVRPNLLRHIRQILKYVYPFWEQGTDVCPGLTYPRSPKSKARRLAIEALLEERGIQVVWVDERAS